MNKKYKLGLQGLCIAALLGVSLSSYSVVGRSLNMHDVKLVNKTSTTYQVTIGSTPKGTLPANGTWVQRGVNDLPTLRTNTLRIRCSDRTFRNDKSPRTCTVISVSCACVK